MPRLNRFLLVVAIVAFCFGIAIGRFAIPTSTSNPVARAESISNNRSSGIETNGASVQHHSGSKRNSRPESTEAAGPDGNIYARITDSLTASGTARLYDSFGKFSNLIDQKNVRDVLAFAEKISRRPPGRPGRYRPGSMSHPQVGDDWASRQDPFWPAGAGSLGRPSTISPRMLRWTCEEPA